MDLVTHAGLGILCARSLNSQRLPLRWAVGAGVVGALFPDVDFVLFLWDPLQFHAHWHRSFTHSLIMVPLWSALLATSLYGLGGRRQAWSLLYLCVGLGMVSHMGADLITAWDLQWLWPLSGRGDSLAWAFVIDPWLSALLFVGVLLSLRWQRMVWLTWAGLAVWLGWLALNKHEARQIADAFADTMTQTSAELPASPLKADAWPQPFSPRHWKLLVSTGDGHWQAHVRLADRPSALNNLWPHPQLRAMAAAYGPVADTEWQYWPRFAAAGDDTSPARQLWYSEMLGSLRQFYQYPARYYPAEESPHCLWFTDLLYVLPSQRPPFLYGACREGDDDWQPARLPIQIAEPWEP